MTPRSKPGSDAVARPPTTTRNAPPGSDQNSRQGQGEEQVSRRLDGGISEGRAGERAVLPADRPQLPDLDSRRGLPAPLPIRRRQDGDSVLPRVRPAVRQALQGRLVTDSGTGVPQVRAAAFTSGGGD